MLRREPKPRRNEKCFCGSGRKYKYCHAKNATVQPQLRECTYIDDGETAVRYVIANERATGFFSTAANAILVFRDRATATAIATLPEFDGQQPGEINVASVGETKFKVLQEKLPFVEIDEGDVETAVALVRQRLEAGGYPSADPDASKEKNSDVTSEE